jgi:hypothetical protein
LGDGHKDAFVTLDAVAGLDLREGENRNGDGEHERHDAYGLCGEDSLEPFSKILTQKTENNDSKNELYPKKRERPVQIHLSDGFPVLDVRGEVNKEGYGYSNKCAENACGVS